MEEKKKENGNGKAGTQSFGNGVPDVRDCARVKQKRGKKRMRQVGNVELPQDAFMTALKVDE